MKHVTYPPTRTRGTFGLAVCGLTLAFSMAMQPAYAQSESNWSNQGLIYLLGPTLSASST